MSWLKYQRLAFRCGSELGAVARWCYFGRGAGCYYRNGSQAWSGGDWRNFTQYLYRYCVWHNNRRVRRGCVSVALGVDFPSTMKVLLVVGTLFGIIAGTAFTFNIEIGIVLSLSFAVMAALSLVRNSSCPKSSVFIWAHYRQGRCPPPLWSALSSDILSSTMGMALASLLRTAIHPLCWDELTVLSLPCTKRSASEYFDITNRKGCVFLRRSGVTTFEERHCKPCSISIFTLIRLLRFLYALLANPAMREYFCS